MQSEDPSTYCNMKNILRVTQYSKVSRKRKNKKQLQTKKKEIIEDLAEVKVKGSSHLT